LFLNIITIKTIPLLPPSFLSDFYNYFMSKKNCLLSAFVDET